MLSVKGTESGAPFLLSQCSLDTPLEENLVKSLGLLPAWTSKKMLTTRGPCHSREWNRQPEADPEIRVTGTGAAWPQSLWPSCALTLALFSTPLFLTLPFVFSSGCNRVWSERVYRFHVSERRLQNHPWVYWGLHLLVNPLQGPERNAGRRSVP